MHLTRYLLLVTYWKYVTLLADLPTPRRNYDNLVLPLSAVGFFLAGVHSVTLEGKLSPGLAGNPQGMPFAVSGFYCELLSWIYCLQVQSANLMFSLAFCFVHTVQPVLRIVTCSNCDVLGHVRSAALPGLALGLGPALQTGCTLPAPRSMFCL